MSTNGRGVIWLIFTGVLLVSLHQTGGSVHKGRTVDSTLSPRLHMTTQLFAAALLRPANSPVSKELKVFLSSPVDESDWQLYLTNEGLDKFPPLASLFTPELKALLLNDLALKPVFLTVVPDDYLGEFESINNVAAKELGGDKFLRDLLSSYSVFQEKNKKRIASLASQGRVVVGVTDRYSSLTMDYQVANNRMVYFPLPDGTFLLVKGTGQNQGAGLTKETSTKPFFLNKRHNPPRLEGVLLHYETKRAVHAFSHFPQKFILPFSQLLGMRKLLRLRDDAGKWIDYSQQNDDNIPMLGFYRVLYPQRVVKLPQLLEHDRDLYYVRKRLSLVLGEKGLLPFDLRNSDIMTPAQFMDMLIDNMGTAEAMKQNRGFFKITLHVQDNGLPHENDWEEFWPKETYDQFLAQYEYVPGGVLIKDVYQKTNFGARDIRAKMLMLLQIVERWPVISAQKAIERFFKAYFRELNSEYVQGFIHAIQTAGIESYLDAIIDSRLEDKLVRELRVNINRIKREIIKWAAEELDSRQGRKISAVTMRRFESHGSKWTGADDKISQLPEQAI